MATTWHSITNEALKRGAWSYKLEKKGHLIGGCFKGASFDTAAVYLGTARDTGNLIFRYLQQRSPVQIWLYEQLDTRIEGQIIGFDEFMNLVLDSAFEVDVKKGTRKEIGRILLKGDNITLIQSVSAPAS
ncbi:hypothetical protein BGZ95_012139 [Linnemannia exigua]|uniref:Small nuclear ribonucleoprotein E n=1 Tax=Linnemannia exigua TaxID=604196 RepID=A0AAD4DJI2_9FUNG|nr:hypothetical protein BGZ95_012139 [Linnemannia exigua]